MPSLILQCLSDNIWKSPSVPFFNTTLPVKGEEECRGGSLDWPQLKNRIRFNWKYLSSGYVFFCFHCSLGRGRDGHRSDFLPTSTGMWGATTPPSETDLSMKNIWGFFVQNWHNVLKLFPPFCNRIGNGRCVAQTLGVPLDDSFHGRARVIKRMVRRLHRKFSLGPYTQFSRAPLLLIPHFRTVTTTVVPSIDHLLQ